MREHYETMQVAVGPNDYNIDVYYHNCDYDDANPRHWESSSVMATVNIRHKIGEVTLKTHGESLSSDFRIHLAKDALQLKDVIYLPVFLYKHSGTTISTSPFYCPFDSGQIGFIYETKSQIRQEFGVKRINKDLLDKIHERLKDEVDLMAAYIEGSVFEFSIPGLDEDCRGAFYGIDHKTSGLITEARHSIEGIRAYQETQRLILKKKRENQLKWQIRNRLKRTRRYSSYQM